MSKSTQPDKKESSVYIGYIEDGDQMKQELVSNPANGAGSTSGNSSTDDSIPWLVNKVGGTPIFPYSERLISELEATLTRLACKQCKEPCVLLFQISSPIDDSPLDRVIQVYVCVTKNCSKHTYYALRCMLTQCSDSRSNTSVYPTSDKFDFVDDIRHGRLVVCKDRQFFDPYYISVVEEPTGKEDFAKVNLEALKLASKFIDPDHKPAAIEAKYKNVKNYQAPKEPAHLSDLDDFEKFQMERLYGNDKDLYRYYKRINRFQGQIVRYDWEGQALLNSSKIKIKLLPCATCSSKRNFEMQIMSALINYLKTDKEFDRDSHDFASVVISSCSKNCSSKTFAIEDTYIMPDPDSRILNKVKQRVIALKTKGGDEAPMDLEEEADDQNGEEISEDDRQEVSTSKINGPPSSSSSSKRKKNKKKK